MSTLTTNPPARDADVELTPEELARQKFENRLETEGGIEFVDGQVVEKPMSVEACEVEMNIGTILKTAGRGESGWRVFSSGLGYKVYPSDPRKFRKPDVSAVRRSRLASMTEDQGFMTIPADLAVEVMSPDDNSYDMESKVAEYLEHGFAMVWVVYPHTRTAYVHVKGQTRRLGPDDAIDGGDVLPGFACKVADFFAD